MVDLSVWRVCDAGGFLLAPGRRRGETTCSWTSTSTGTWRSGRSCCRSLALLPVDRGDRRLLGEVPALEHRGPRGGGGARLEPRGPGARGGRAGAAGFTREDFHRLVLKVAFLDLPAWRIFGALGGGDGGPLRDAPGLRDGAGGGGPDGVEGHLPLPRARAGAGHGGRILGGIEHGDDRAGSPPWRASSRSARGTSRPTRGSAWPANPGRPSPAPARRGGRPLSGCRGPGVPDGEPGRGPGRE